MVATFKQGSATMLEISKALAEIVSVTLFVGMIIVWAKVFEVCHDRGWQCF